MLNERSAPTELAGGTAQRYVLTARGRDRIGNMAAITTWLAQQDLFVRELQQFRDEDSGELFARIQFAHRTMESVDPAILAAMAEKVLNSGLQPRVYHLDKRLKTILFVSRFGHCLQDIVHRWQRGRLPIDIVGVISNHTDLQSFAQWAGIPYFHLPVSAAQRFSQEQEARRIITDLDVELVVLARYMQILSDDFARDLHGRCINIHHSFLPSFKGARPYHQAHARGIKLIGATAHYVTENLDEGPIIEQQTRRIGHGASAEDLVSLGEEVESAVLARAVNWHAERRIMISGGRTIIFDRMR